MAKKVKAWLHRDGSLSLCKEDADQVGIDLELQQAMLNDELWMYGRLNIEDVDTLKSFLKRHKKLILEILGN